MRCNSTAELALGSVLYRLQQQLLQRNGSPVDCAGADVSYGLSGSRWGVYGWL
jgi:hypothetical protein